MMASWWPRKLILVRKRKQKGARRRKRSSRASATWFSNTRRPTPRPLIDSRQFEDYPVRWSRKQRAHRWYGTYFRCYAIAPDEERRESGLLQRCRYSGFRDKANRA